MHAKLSKLKEGVYGKFNKKLLALGREEGLKFEVDVEFLGHSLEHLVKVDRNLM